MTLIKLNTKFLGDELRNVTDSSLDHADQALASIENGTCPGPEWTGWWNYPQVRGYKVLEEVERYLKDIKVHYDLVLVIGIGGSYLGTRAVYEAMSHTYRGLVEDRRPMLVFAGHHLSEAGLIETLDLLEGRQPIVNVISKSGTTTEPSVAFRVIRTYMEERFGKSEAAQRFVVTTDQEKGALKQIANAEGYQSFVIPDDVGGRYSVLSPVGLVPLGLAKWNIKAMMDGADQVFGELVKDKEERKNHPVLAYAAARNAAYQQDKRIEILSYNNPKLYFLVEWWKQLFGESEGKDGKGIFPAGLGFTTDLHSLGQYVQDGVRNILETFLYFDKESAANHASSIERQLKVPMATDNLDQLSYLEGRPIQDINHAAMVATQVAHFDGGVPSISLTVPRLDEYGLGALFAFFETACAVSGIMLGINPFDQPGVEAYKKNLFGLLGKPGYEDIGNRLKSRI
ncbi:MAG: glucose-6-phosphate isomerase [Oligoflexus sp.]